MGPKTSAKCRTNTIGVPALGAGLVVGLLASLLLGLLGAGAARAVVVTMPDGHVIGVTPRSGVSPASIPGARAKAAQPPSGGNGNVIYHGGPVVQSSAPYLVFWAPPGFSIPGSTKALMTRYFTDVAHDSGLATNVYGPLRQYTDTRGFAAYQQTFSPAAQVISDTNPYPATDTTICTAAHIDPTYYPTCLTDAQLQAEVTNLIATTGLPTDGATSASELAENAPIYFIVTPVNVNICASVSNCADNVFCAYHSNYVDGSNYVLYAAIPLLEAESADPTQNPKNCQSDGNSVIQEPNGNGGDVAIKFMSHEDSETITDPVNGSGWWDSSMSPGNEVGDNCNSYGSTFNAAANQDPFAFVPTLGGSASAGTLYNQLINGDQYYLQSEWSNGDVNCEMRPTAGTVTPSFTGPSGSPPVNTPVTFNGSASSSTNPISSVTWSFGDGTTAFSTATPPGIVSHTYAEPGAYTVTLSIVDTKGNLQSTNQSVTVAASPPTAAFMTVTSPAVAGSPVSFDGTASSDPNNAGAITSYSWSFGDGANGTGPTPSHTYAGAGPYTVALTVTDNFGISSTPVMKSITVYAPLTNPFTFTPASPVPVGELVSFAAIGSPDPNSGGTITSYSWSFGDNASAAGATANHAYASPGIYVVSLTVHDTLGISTTTTEHLQAIAAPTAAFDFSPDAPISTHPVAFDATGSSDPNIGASISSYTWSFGDGGSASGPSPSHTYAAAGRYTVTLTVKDSFGLSATATGVITVAAPGRPTVKTSLSGVGRGAPVLTVQVSAGSGAPNLERIAIRLPGGLAFVKKSLARGLKVTGAHAFSLSHGMLTITLRHPASMVRITVVRPAITVSRALARKVARRAVKTLEIAVTAVDSRGLQTRLRSGAHV